ALQLNLRQIRGTVAEGEALYKQVRHEELITQPLLNFVCHRRGLRVVGAPKLGVQAVDINNGWANAMAMTRTINGDVRTGEGQAILRAHWAGPEKYLGQITHRELADEL